MRRRWWNSTFRRAVLVAEIGDITRFSSADKLTCWADCWAGLTPLHRESDTKVRRGRITKQGSRLVRWAVVESVQMLPPGPGSGPSGTRLPPAANSSTSTTPYATDTFARWGRHPPAHPPATTMTPGPCEPANPKLVDARSCRS